MNNPEVVTLCGSVRFAAEHLAVHRRLSLAGCVVLLPAFPMSGCATAAPDVDTLAALHRHKIELSDRVHVVNPGNYIGPSTASEIAYAEGTGKRVTYEHDTTSSARGVEGICRSADGQAARDRLTRNTGRVDIRLADEGAVQELARLLWGHAAAHEQQRTTVESFTVDLAIWWTERRESHFAFVAHTGTEAVGMAWVALVPRVPRPGSTVRRSGDIQSVFVLPEHRGQGIGAQLIEAAVNHATRLGARDVTVHSGSTAVPLYERLGFSSSRRLLQRPAE